MQDNIRRRYSEMVGGGMTPEKVPDHIVRAFDDAVKVYYPMTTFNTIPRDHWPLIVILADRIKALEDRIAALSTTKADDPSEVGQGAMEAPPDLRTKEGKAWKAQRELAAVGA